MKRILRLCVAAGAVMCVGQASAQTYEQGGARITFQVWEPALNLWTHTVQAMPGMRVEWRIVLSYTGTRTDIFALGEALYQPTISEADITDGGNGVDEFGPWRNGGVSGNSIAGSMLTAAEGEQGTALASYGRVRFGGTVAAASASNVLTTFRHSGGGGGAPAGDYMRIAGNFVSQWPRSLVGPVPPLDVTTDDVNSVLRGVSSMQQSQALSPAFHVAGTTNLVVFRGALIMSADTSWPTSMQLTTFRESFRRVGGPTGATEGDDRRYFTWQTGAADSGSHRTVDPQIVPAFIQILPAPGAGFAFIVFGLSAARRRRSGLGSVVPFRSTP